MEPRRISSAELDRCIANVYGFYSTWAMVGGKGLVIPQPGLVLIDSGTDLVERNIAFVEGGETAVDSVRVAARFFGELGRPWRLDTPAELRDSFAPVANELGLSAPALRPGLTVNSKELRATAANTDFLIERVTTPEQAGLFLRTLVEGMVGEKIEGVAPPGRLDFPGITCYLGRVRGEPVATGILYQHRGIAGIYGVATVSRARQRGYGRAITELAAQDGFRDGCSLSFLEASDMGRPLYESMGYAWAFDRAVWVSDR